MRLARQTASGNGKSTRVEGEVPFALEPARRGGRVRVPELVVGVLLVVGFALAAVLWMARANDRQPVLVLAAPVERGQMLEAGDVGVAYVGSGDRLAVLPQSAAAGLVGQVAVADLPAGTVITAEQFASGTPVADGTGVVGVALDPGEYPLGQLHPGDQVNVVLAADQGDAPAATAWLRGEIFDVAEVGSGQLLVSLQMAEEDANRVAQAAASGQAVRLVLVGAR